MEDWQGDWDDQERKSMWNIYGWQFWALVIVAFAAVSMAVLF